MNFRIFPEIAKIKFHGMPRNKSSRNSNIKLNPQNSEVVDNHEYRHKLQNEDLCSAKIKTTFNFYRVHCLCKTVQVYMIICTVLIRR